MACSRIKRSRVSRIHSAIRGEAVRDSRRPIAPAPERWPDTAGATETGSPPGDRNTSPTRAARAERTGPGGAAIGADRRAGADAAAVRQALEALARQLQASRQKDTTQDYRPAHQPSQGQGLE